MLWKKNKKFVFSARLLLFNDTDPFDKLIVSVFFTFFFLSFNFMVHTFVTQTIFGWTKNRIHASTRSTIHRRRIALTNSINTRIHQLAIVQQRHQAAIHTRVRSDQRTRARQAERPKPDPAATHTTLNAAWPRDPVPAATATVQLQLVVCHTELLIDTLTSVSNGLLLLFTLIFAWIFNKITKILIIFLRTVKYI